MAVLLKIAWDYRTANPWCVR